MSKTVFILGSGASHGSGFTGPYGIKPPLLSEFFKVCAGFDYFRKELIKKSLLNFLEENLGWKEDVLVNGVFDLEDVIDKIDQIVEKNRSPKYALLRRNLEILVAEVLHKTTWCPGEKENDYSRCPYHRKIVSSLKPGDFIINLNYDLIMDVALKESNKWNYIKGYGLCFEYSLLKEKWRKVNNPGEQTNYFKLNGSLNWFSSTGYVIREAGSGRHIHYAPQAENRLHVIDPIRWYKYYNGTQYEYGGYFDDMHRYSLQTIIVAPGRNKKFMSIMEPVWDAAGEKLKDVARVIVVGNSLREKDLNFRALLKNIGWSSLETFILVDPDTRVERKYEREYGRAPDKRFNDLRAFASNIENI